MKRSIFLALGLLVAAFGAGCAPDEGGDGYSDADLARYKSALPARSTLETRAPAATSAAAFGTTSGNAVYPGFAVPFAIQVNGLIGGTLDIIEFVSELEPTVYDSEDLEFWWGPIPDQDSPIDGDHFSLYIHDRIEDPEYDPMNDLRYEFAVIRGVGNDVSTLTPIIFGGGTPVEGTDDDGIGVLLYDFDNNVEFEDLHNPGHGPLTSGRMATIFAKGPDQTNPNADVTYVVAAFREFLPEDAGVGAQAANVDYFWGKFSDGTSQFDFLDFAFQADLDDDSGDALEDFAMKLAFYNEGVGRAAAQVSGGDVAPNVGDVTECWDAALQQDYVSMVISSNGNVVAGPNEAGNEALCVWDDAEFDNIPDRGDAADLVTLVGTIADAGMPSDLPEEND